MAAAPEVLETTNNNNNDLPIREDLIDTAIKFLQNPKVIQSPLAQKQTFLQRRGLSDKEIQVACERAGAYAHHEQQQSLPQQLPPPLPPNVVSSYRGYGQMQLSLFDKIRDVVHSVAIFSIVAYVIHKLYQNYIAPFLFGRKKKSVEDTVTDLERNMKVEITKLRDRVDEVRVEIDRFSLNGNDSTSRQLSELKSEISTVKGLLLTRKQFPSVATTPIIPPSIPAWQMSSVPPEGEQEGEHEEHKEELEELGSGSGSSEPEHGMKTSESSLEIIFSSKDCDSESCHSRKSNKEDSEKE